MPIAYYEAGECIPARLILATVTLLVSGAEADLAGGESTLEKVPKTWQGRRVFLTGHTGFKGSWLALWLSRLGAKVRGYALDP